MRSHLLFFGADNIPLGNLEHPELQELLFLDLAAALHIVLTLLGLLELLKLLHLVALQVLRHLNIFMHVINLGVASLLGTHLDGLADILLLLEEFLLVDEVVI